MMPPRYQDIKASAIPEVTLEGGVTAKVICGQLADVTGPVQDIIIDPLYLDVTVPGQTTCTLPTRPGHTLIAFVIGGSGYFCPEKKPFSHEIEGTNYFDMEPKSILDDGTLVLFTDGESLFVNTEEDSFRFLLISGKPLKEPVAWHGPIVMNTREELRLAFEEYENGNFIKNP